MERDNIIIAYLKNHLPKINVQFDCINSGGCGIFAFFLYRELKAIGIETKIIMLDSPWSEVVDPDTVNSLNSINELNELGGNFAHAVLKYKDYYMDSTAVDTDYANMACKNKRFACELIPDTLERLIDDVSGWNYMFKREQVPAIEVKIIEMVEGLKEKLQQYHYLYVRGMDTSNLLAA